MVASAAISWMLLGPPVSESHYFVMLLQPLAGLAEETLAPANPATGRFARRTLIVFGAVSLGAMSGESVKLYGLLCWATVGLWAALVTLAARRTGITAGHPAG